ncbi:UNVERIFIED_CONTAM: hypothetical protein K2H54_057888 [Gekko kuhli]
MCKLPSIPVNPDFNSILKLSKELCTGVVSWQDPIQLGTTESCFTAPIVKTAKKRRKRERERESCLWSHCPIWKQYRTHLDVNLPTVKSIQRIRTHIHHSTQYILSPMYITTMLKLLLICFSSKEMDSALP